MRDIAVALCCIVTVAATHTAAAYTPSVSREEIAGVWSLALSQSFLLPRTQTTTKKTKTEKELLLRLNQDGSFVQYGGRMVNKEDEGLVKWLEQAQVYGSDGTLQERRDAEKVPSLHGMWDYRDGKLLLAADRPTNVDALQVHDTLFAGTLVAHAVSSLSDTLEKEKDNSVVEESKKAEQNDDIYLVVPKGQVYSGKFMYPRHHPSFFDHPIVRPTTTGRFTLRQVLGKLNTQRRDNDNTEKVVRYRKRDFYGRKFLLTVSPLKRRRGRSKLVWSRQAGGYVQEGRPEDDPEELQPFDVRVMPIEFFKNNTFTAMGMNKILRGRYGMTGDEKEQLWFVVSLFGNGRSMKGSVYSEGQGLTHDDRRSYVGVIKEMEVQGTKRFHVEGSVIYGTDFVTRTAASVGTFVMKETSDSSCGAVHGNHNGGNEESTSDSDAFQ